MHNKILVVEDDQDIRDALRDGLEMMGYQVHTSSNGKEALAYLAQVQDYPCLIFLDLMMPIMDGWEFRTHQSADPRFSKIPVVVITANGNAKQKAEQMGASVGLQKPLEFERLFEVAQTYCNLPTT